MKMTRLEWRYLQRIALDHPYFDTHKLPLTEKEAKAIVEANIKMTGKEFVDSIYAKLGMTRPKEEKERFAKLRSVGELFTVPPIRKIAIAVLVVVLMTVFFTATPTGRAIAESVIHYITHLYDEGIIISQNDRESNLVFVENSALSVGTEQQGADSNIEYVNTFNSFIESTGKTPIILPLSHETIYYEYDEFLDVLILYAVYESPQGRIFTMQTWGAEEIIDTTSTNFNVYDAYENIYYSIEKEGKIVICKTLEDSYFTMNVKGDYTLEDLVGLLKNN